jgi:hypothetical protein
MMDSHGTYGPESTEVFSASGSAIAQQTMTGEGGNLDSQNTVNLALSLLTRDEPAPCLCYIDADGGIKREKCGCSRTLFSFFSGWEPSDANAMAEPSKCWLISFTYAARLSAWSLLGPWPQARGVKDLLQRSAKTVRRGNFSVTYREVTVNTLEDPVRVRLGHMVAERGLSYRQFRREVPDDVYLGGAATDTVATSSAAQQPPPFWGLLLAWWLVYQLLAVLLSVPLASGLRMLVELGLPNPFGFIEGLHDGLSPFKPDCSLPYFGPIDDARGSCIWRALRRIGYTQFDLINAGIRPWSVKPKLGRMWLPLFWTRVGTPHVSATPFSGARFGLCASQLKTGFLAGDQFYTDFGSSAPDADASARKARFKAITEIPAPRYPQLGGAQRVPSQYLYAAKANAFGETWKPGFFPADLTRQAARTVGNFTRGPLPIADAIEFTRDSEFQMHYPDFSNRMTQYKRQAPHVTWASQHVITSTAEVLTMPRRPKDHSAILQPRFNQLRPLFEDDISNQALSAIETVMAQRRMGGTRGNRLIPGWEAGATRRIEQWRSLLQETRAGQLHYRVLVMLWSRYLQASIRNHVAATAPDCPTWAQPDRTVGPMAPAPIFDNLSTVLDPALQPPVDPEAALWTEAQLEGLASGQRVLIDAEGVDDETLLELIRCYLPFQADDRWSLQIPATVATAARAATDTTPAIAAAPALAAEDWWVLAQSRVVHGAARVLLHWGRELPRLSTDQLNNTAGVAGAVDILGLPPNRWATLKAIRHLVNRHHCGAESLAAFDFAFWEQFGFQYVHSPVTKANAPRGIVPAHGTNTLRLPRDFTSPVYFDVFTTPLPTPGPVAALFNATPGELAWSAFIATIGMGSALNWASYAFTLTGEVWDYVANQQAGVSQFLKLHADAFTHTVLSDDTNPWSVNLGNAQAMMYGFGPAAETRLCTMQRVDPHWGKYSAPLFANPYYEMWALQVLPSHQMFPLPQGTPLWEANEPRPVAGRLDFSGRVRLARDLPKFSGRSWLADGGMEYSARYYANCGTGAYLLAGRTAYRHDRSSVAQRYVALSAWDSPFQHEWPADPNAFNVTWTEAPGGVFADFIAPGTLRSFNLPNNRLRAMGARANWVSTSAEQEGLKTAMFNAARGVPLQGVCITYIHPVPAMREFEEVQDYSMIEIIDAESGAYAGLVSVSKDTSPAAYADNSYLPDPSSGWSPHEKAPLNLPAYLANNNDPGQPRWRRSKSGDKPVGKNQSDLEIARTAPAGGFLDRRFRTIEEDRQKREQSEAEAQAMSRQRSQTYRPSTTQPGASLVTGEQYSQPLDAGMQPFTDSVYSDLPVEVSQAQHAMAAEAIRQGVQYPNFADAPTRPASSPRFPKAHTSFTRGRYSPPARHALPAPIVNQALKTAWRSSAPVPIAPSFQGPAPTTQKRVSFAGGYESKNPSSVDELPLLEHVPIVPPSAHRGPEPTRLREPITPVTAPAYAEAGNRFSIDAIVGAPTGTLAPKVGDGNSYLTAAVPANMVVQHQASVPTDVAAPVAQHMLVDMSDIAAGGTATGGPPISVLSQRMIGATPGN